MQRINLKTDRQEPTTVNLKEDLSELRNILQTLLREYHKSGGDKFKEVEKKTTESLLVSNDTRKQVELIKNDTAHFERDLRKFDIDRKETELLLNKAITKLNVFTLQFNEKMDNIEKSYNKLLNSFGGDFLEDNHNIATLAIRLSNTIKEVDKIKKRKFFGIF